MPAVERPIPARQCMSKGEGTLPSSKKLRQLIDVLRRGGSLAGCAIMKIPLQMGLFQGNKTIDTWSVTGLWPKPLSACGESRK